MRFDGLNWDIGSGSEVDLMPREVQTAGGHLAACDPVDSS